MIAERDQRVQHHEAKIDARLGPRRALREVVESDQSSLEQGDGGARSRPADRSNAGPEKMLDRDRPELGLKRMLGKIVDLLVEPFGMEQFDLRRDLRMQCAARVKEQAFVGDVASERVLERVLLIRRRLRFVKEVRCLEFVKVEAEAIFRKICDFPQQCDRNSTANRGCNVKHAAQIGLEPIDARRQNRFDSRRNADLTGVFGRQIVARASAEGAGLNQRAHALLDKQRISSCSPNQDPLDLLQGQGVAQEMTQHGPGRFIAQRQQTRRVAKVAPDPRVRVLRTMGDKEQDARGHHPLHELVHDGLRLGVYPLQILEHHERRPVAGQGPKERLYRVDDPAPALHQVEFAPSPVNVEIQEPVQDRQYLQQALVDRG